MVNHLIREFFCVSNFKKYSGSIILNIYVRVLTERILDRISAKKKQLEAKRPFPVEPEKNLYNWSKMGLTYTSNALEGNTLTEGETALVAEIRDRPDCFGENRFR